MENTTQKTRTKLTKEEKRQLKQQKKFTKVEKSWIMYDWANSIYATNIMAAIFPIYFAMMATDTGNKIFGYAVSAANLLVALLSPLLGAIGDFKGMKKKLFGGFLIDCFMKSLYQFIIIKFNFRIINKEMKKITKD